MQKIHKNNSEYKAKELAKPKISMTSIEVSIEKIKVSL